MFEVRSWQYDSISDFAYNVLPAWSRYVASGGELDRKIYSRGKGKVYL